MGVFLRNGRYRIFATANLVSSLGSVLFSIVFIVYARHMPNPRLAISVASVLASSAFVCDVFMGYLADRTVNHYRQQQVGRLIQGSLFLLTSGLLVLPPAWPRFVGMLTLNVACGLVATYNGYGGVAIIKDIVPQADIAEAQGFVQGIDETLSITGGLVGVGLLALLRYHYSLFALLNAVSFFLAFGVLFVNRRQYTTLSSSRVTLAQQSAGFWRSSWTTLKSLKRYGSIPQFIGTFAAVNLFDAGQEVLLNLTFIQQRDLLFGTYGYTVALVGMASSIGSIVGALLPGRLTKRLPIATLILGMFGVYGLLVLNVLTVHNRYLLLGLIICCGGLSSVASIQVQARMITQIPSASVGSVLSVFFTVVQATIPVGTLVFSSLANIRSIRVAWTVLLGVDVLTAAWWLGKQRRSKLRDQSPFAGQNHEI